ncbi:hypothetical protein CGCF415_v015464 [Colletotrichum fructicola]|nr:hypothetical protein CGCFRS4_v014769 [Colletotrichum fructicola]KAF4885144.1 hypothetical protein CGCF415_v015464 [Colletotrichum fructicola]KAF4922321.1 hypothetical protein CGCF245_v015360 [Colletotrichum fructicola]
MHCIIPFGNLKHPSGSRRLPPSLRLRDWHLLCRDPSRATPTPHPECFTLRSTICLRRRLRSRHDPVGDAGGCDIGLGFESAAKSNRPRHLTSDTPPDLALRLHHPDFQLKSCSSIVFLGFLFTLLATYEVAHQQQRRYADRAGPAHS